MKNSTFKLFSNCIPVNGAKRSLIADIQRGNYYLIPEGLFEILTEYEDTAIESIKDNYNHQIDDFIDKSFEYLEKEELGFYCENPEQFPKLSMEWNSPNIIENAIIEIKSNEIDYVATIIEQLTLLRCKFIEFRIYQQIEIDELTALVQITKTSTLRNISILMLYTETFTLDKIERFLNRNQRVGEIVFYTADKDDLITRKGGEQIYFTKQNLSTNLHCGQIHSQYFSTNIKTFTESQHHNTCLNRKISIDQNGEIKNCPSMTESYGNIANTSLQEALNHPDFKKYWNIKKDQISVCQDCEFRHICTDCRAYLENPEDIYSKPLKCGYNPYTCEWEDWSTNPLKEKAIKHYGMTTM